MENSVYDPEKQQDSDSSEPRTIHKNPVKHSEDAKPHEDLRNAESSGDGLFNPKGDQEDKGSSVSPAALLGRESGGNTGSSGSFNFNPGRSQAAKTTGSGFKNFFWGSTKRKRTTIGGGVTASLLLGGGVLTIFLLAGPAQMIQLDQTLQRNFTGTNQASSSRLGQMVLNARAQDLGETRLNVLGRQYFRGYRAALSEKGIDFNTNAFDQFGGRDAATFDTEKLKHGSPELEGMTSEQKKVWIEQTFDVPADALTNRGGGLFGLDATGWSNGQISDFFQKSIGILGNGRVSNSIANRQFSKYFDNPKMWHIFEFAKSSIIKRILNGDNAKQAEKQEQRNEEKVDVAKLGEVADGNVSSLKDKAGTADDFATKALTYTGTACLVKTTAGDIIAINRYRVVLPAAVMALRFIAIGEQIKAGQDVSADQIGAAEQSLYNNQGQGVWQGRALQATSGDSNPSGPDIPTEYQQAFNANTTTNNIESVADATLGGAAAASFLCGRVGTILQAGISIVQIFGSAGLEVFSDGTATPEVAASLASKFKAAGAIIGIDAIKMGGQVEALGFAQHFVIDKNASGKLAEDAFSGPLGGNLLAYGAREAANMGAIASGGIALSSSDSHTYATAQQQIDEQQFRSESFLTRTFDVGDSRTLTGHLAQSVSPNSSQNVASIVGSFTNIGNGLLSNLASIFVPRSHALADYDWTFPQYGIPQDMLQDPALADPYANADVVSKTLDAECLKPDGSVDKSCSPIDKAKKCFGADIDKDGSGAWNVTTVGNYQPQTSDINPNATDYVNSDCSDLSDTHWKRLVMFIFDMRTAQASACFSGDDQSCKDVGYDQTDAAAGGSTAPTDGSLPSGNTQQLAQQIVDLHNQGKITYAVDSSQLDSNFKRMANGEKPQTDNGHQPTPDPRILQAIIYLAQQGTVQLNSYVDGESHTSPGNPHYEGRAIDIGAFKGHTLGSGDVATTKEVEEIVSHVLPEHSRFGADFYTDISWTEPINLSGKTFYAGNDAPAHLHVDTLNVD